MRVIILYSAVLLFIGCINHSTSVVEDNKTAPITSTSKNSNANYIGQDSDSDYKYDEVRLDKLDSENERFRVVPDEWKQIDFENYNYPNNWKEKEITLKDGKYEFTEHRGFVAFENVFYVDLTNDDKKEAVVLLKEFLCETGCDGGSEDFFIFTHDKAKPELIWQYSGGSRGYDGGLKSFLIKNKEIVTEKYLSCSASDMKNSGDCMGKFRAKNIYRQTFAFNGKKIIEISKETIETPIINVFNYLSEISIND